MRRSVQRGRTRKRMPSASPAAFTNGPSVSSSQTSTRASFSRTARPSEWMLPASTTSGRTSSRAMSEISFPRRSALSALHYRRAPVCYGGSLVSTLVTGGFGCIGSWVVRALLAEGERPVIFDLGDDPWRMRMIAGPDVASRITIVRGDIADLAAIQRIVNDHGIRRIIHLAAWQVPLCRQDPPRGAAINVVGTANVFEVARASAGQIERVVYASSAAVFGAPSLYPPGPIADDAPARPATHYGVYKVANEETARVYWEEHRIPSSGFRPLTVYRPGRDFGLTADPTLAMKAAVLGRPFQIRWGRSTSSTSRTWPARS